MPHTHSVDEQCKNPISQEPVQLVSLRSQAETLPLQLLRLVIYIFPSRPLHPPNECSVWCAGVERALHLIKMDHLCQHPQPLIYYLYLTFF